MYKYRGSSLRLLLFEPGATALKPRLPKGRSTRATAHTEKGSTMASSYQDLIYTIQNLGDWGWTLLGPVLKLGRTERISYLKDLIVRLAEEAAEVPNTNCLFHLDRNQLTNLTNLLFIAIEDKHLWGHFEPSRVEIRAESSYIDDGKPAVVRERSRALSEQAQMAIALHELLPSRVKNAPHSDKRVVCGETRAMLLDKITEAWAKTAASEEEKMLLMKLGIEINSSLYAKLVADAFRKYNEHAGSKKISRALLYLNKILRISSARVGLEAFNTLAIGLTKSLTTDEIVRCAELIAVQN